MLFIRYSLNIILQQIINHKQANKRKYIKTNYHTNRQNFSKQENRPRKWQNYSHTHTQTHTYWHRDLVFSSRHLDEPSICRAFVPSVSSIPVPLKLLTGFPSRTNHGEAVFASRPLVACKNASGMSLQGVN